MNIQLTSHALKRAHQRLSLKKRSVQRAAELALSRGTSACRSGSNDPWILGNHPSTTSCREILNYGNAYYVFEYSERGIQLITVMIAKPKKGGYLEHLN